MLLEGGTVVIVAVIHFHRCALFTRVVVGLGVRPTRMLLGEVRQKGRLSAAVLWLFFSTIFLLPPPVGSTPEAP